MNNYTNPIETVIGTIQSMQAEIEAQKVKVLFADALTASSQSIKVGDLAVMLKQAGVNTGRDRLYQWMRDNGYVCRMDCGNNRPTQRSLELGVLELQAQAVVNAYGRTSITYTTKVTPKGQMYFFDKVLAQKDVINAIEAEKQQKRQAC